MTGNLLVLDKTDVSAQNELHLTLIIHLTFSFERIFSLFVLALHTYLAGSHYIHEFIMQLYNEIYVAITFICNPAIVGILLSGAPFIPFL